MKSSTLLVALVASFCFALAAADCNVAITQTLGSSWTQNGQAMSQWNAQLTAGSEQVHSVQLAISGATLTQLWGLTRNDSTGLYGLPPYRLMAGGLGAGETHQFGYIWESSQQATITVSSIDCGAAASPSASPSASPVVVGSAAPSTAASPAASASASPAASGDCRLTVTQTKRAANDGGSWTTGDFGFQIYDLSLNNVGSRAASNAVINIALNANAQQQIYQFWNIERQAADSSVFNVPTPWGAIQVGASQGAGYIVRYALAAADNQVDPTVTVQSATCQGATVSPPPAVSAAPSAAPSTIVSTPQPSSSADCKATVSIVARSAANSGAWQSNGASFQIFDLTIANAGSKPIKGAELTFGLPSGTTVFQWWELTSRANSANVFDVAFNYGPLQVGATQGAGIVGKSSSSSQDTPTVSIGSITCA